ncbi:uncharacterized protein K489DRAFT_135621 [Dissoconium aciculare CBS 342.82]|uniref:Uncharacterized protein n=1 Tax=Dissoconium aciculare CBS 342.82 TaxID=1314786 RepID=A0A6J3LQD7_9PEZI|nr:uncharacterized protein K489DRAFT_135621 [Dissoconium aciculare CBS 342.82]KAF1818060.1 hypothetical protein K489DRAFT_135621 [Dissoconium aciculare CBS 342.82]
MVRKCNRYGCAKSLHTEYEQGISLRPRHRRVCVSSGGFFYHPMFPRWDLSGSHLDFPLIVRGNNAYRLFLPGCHITCRPTITVYGGLWFRGRRFPSSASSCFPWIPVFTRDLAHEPPGRSSQLTSARFIEDGKIVGGHRHRVIRCAACVRGAFVAIPVCLDSNARHYQYKEQCPGDSDIRFYVDVRLAGETRG